MSFSTFGGFPAELGVLSLWPRTFNYQLGAVGVEGDIHLIYFITDAQGKKRHTEELSV